MIDHATFRVGDLSRSRRFFVEALAPLGYRVVAEYPQGIGLGAGARADFWVILGAPGTTGVHVAFAAETRAAVDAFHAAALKAGGVNNGAPGVRARYHPEYYGAFVLDPEGNNVEAVCHEPQGPAPAGGRDRREG
jgi:catechol 2,3-dioxygenase-like lactoylglutathione lyase family enzyme